MFNQSDVLRSESGASSGETTGQSGHFGALTDKTLLVAYEVITPVSSYVALAFVVLVVIVIVISKLVITVETSKSDLLIYNTSPQKLELLVSKPTSNSGATNNMHAAIALGLMDAPANYVPPKQPVNSKMNGFGNHHHQQMQNVSEQAEAEVPVRRKKNFN
jgi:hypothetical protein